VVALCLSLIQEQVSKRTLRMAKGKEEIIELEIITINKRRANFLVPEDSEEQVVDANDEVELFH